MKTIALYPFQDEAVEKLRANIRAGIKNQILAAPTGSGKTVCAAYLLDECVKKGRNAVFVCDRIPLIEQTSRTLDLYGVPHGVIQADHWRRRIWERVQVASAQTLARREWPAADLIVIDEAHTVSKTVVKRISGRDAVVIGLTATPFTRGLGKLYDAVVTVTTTNKLIEARYLAPFRVFAASEPDMMGAKVVAGEWTEDEAAKRAIPIVGDCVAEYLKHGDGKKFIAFGVNVAHCAELQRQFMAAGVQCAMYTYRTSDEERRLLLEEYQKPDSFVRGLISVSALAKGFDVADVEVIIMARPLRSSLAEHIQILGRGLRRHPDKKECIVLDHAGNCLRFWDAMHRFFEDGATTLDDGKRRDAKPRKNKERTPMKCDRCSHVHEPRPMCPACGYEYPKRLQVSHSAGVLSELTGATPGTERQALYSQLLHIARERGYKDGWAFHQFKQRTGGPPSGLTTMEMPPTAALLRWVRSRAIAYAKAKRAA